MFLKKIFFRGIFSRKIEIHFNILKALNTRMSNIFRSYRNHLFIHDAVIVFFFNNKKKR